MAKVVADEMLRRSASGKGQASKYDWDVWFDGRTWELKKGEDFTAQTDGFRATALSAAKRAGGKLLTGKVSVDVIRIRFVKDREAVDEPTTRALRTTR